MLNDLNPTTRRYPRSLNEAFQQDAYEWMEEPPSTINFWDVCIITVVLCMWVMFVYWWSTQ